MANTFAKATKSSLVQSSTGTNESNTASTFDILSLGTSSTAIILSILVSNKVGNSANANLYLLPYVTGTGVYLIKNAPIPAGSALEIISGSKIILNASDILRASSDTASSLDMTISYLLQN
jgi:hypothetical protein